MKGTFSRSISLNGTWELAQTGQKTKIPRTWPGQAKVPGTVYQDLQKAKRIPDPYFGDNFLKCAWVEGKDWWYRKTFRVPSYFKDYARLQLVFKGLDTYATVWLNGSELGKSTNMFVPAVFNVTGKVRLGQTNQLVVRIHSTVKTVRNSRYGKRVRQSVHGNERLFVRKAQYNFGWDIAPRLVSAGVWRGVFLAGENAVSIDDVHIVTRSIGPAAQLTVRITATNHSAGSKQVEWKFKVLDPDGNKILFSKRAKRLKPGQVHWSFSLPVPDPQVWWPAGHGSQPLYTFMTKITDGTGVLDRARKKFGIRMVKLVQRRQTDGGTSFFFKVNNKRVFIKGVNWVPLDAMPARVTKRRYEKAIGLAKKQGLNCIRIWGGGYYEDDYLYDLCDREGILVWQDFMFACARYPEDQSFLDLVRVEAEYVVKHLRSRACLLIWGGDNEVDFSHTWGVKMRKFDDNKINRKVLPEVCRRLSPRIPYIVSSPFSIKDPDPNAAKEGDAHLWHHGIYYNDPVYTGQLWRFVSEIGHLSVPTVSSLKKFIPLKDLWPTGNRMWDHHFGSVFSLKAHPERRKKLDQAIRNVLGYVPEGLGEYIKASQEVQARALVRWIEHARGNKYCGGIIYWNLLDCWPQCSGAVVDYYLEPKKAFYAIQKAFQE